MFRLQASQKNLALAVGFADDVPDTIRTDGGKVRQVLINLLSNGIKFTDKGTVTMRVARVETDEDELRIAVTVQDSGCGIEADKLDFVFGVFTQTELGSQKAGTGLGLAVSRQFARLLGGELTVTSTPGVGSTFRFEFAARTTDSVEASTTVPVVGLAANSKVPDILVVDDLADNRDVLSSMLQAVGFSVRTASGGQEALDHCASEPVDLVLLDLRMPELGGIDVLERLRATEKGADLAVVVVSASALADEQLRVQQAGANGFLSKPVRESELFAMVEQHTGVAYRHAGDNEEDASSSAAEVVEPTVASSGDLPQEIIDGLSRAVESGDIMAIDAYVAEALEHDPVAGSELRKLADGFDYEKLLGMLAATDRN